MTEKQTTVPAHVADACGALLRHLVNDGDGAESCVHRGHLVIGEGENERKVPAYILVTTEEGARNMIDTYMNASPTPGVRVPYEGTEAAGA